MATYTNEQLLDALKQHGVDTSHFGKDIERPESMDAAGLEERVPQPVEIMSAAHALGLVIPWTDIIAYILCVIKSIWDKPLKQALKDCYKGPPL